MLHMFVMVRVGDAIAIACKATFFSIEPGFRMTWCEAQRSSCGISEDHLRSDRADRADMTWPTRGNQSPRASRLQKVRTKYCNDLLWQIIMETICLPGLLMETMENKKRIRKL